MSEIAVLTSEERQLLRGILNCLIPAEGDLPAAGDLGLEAEIERRLAHSPTLRRIFLDGLTEIDIRTAAISEGAFSDLLPFEQAALLADTENDRPDFFGALVEQAYCSYYTASTVLAALGFDPAPPQPRGHDLPPFDAGLLLRQRERPPFWRQVS